MIEVHHPAFTTASRPTCSSKMCSKNEGFEFKFKFNLKDVKMWVCSNAALLITKSKGKWVFFAYCAYIIWCFCKSCSNSLSKREMKSILYHHLHTACSSTISYLPKLIDLSSDCVSCFCTRERSLLPTVKEPSETRSRCPTRKLAVISSVLLCQSHSG